MHSTDLLQRSKGNKMEKKIFSTNGAGIYGHPHVKKKKKESRYRHYTPHKNKLKAVSRPKCKTQNSKILEYNIGGNLDDFEFDHDFFDTTPNA